ncbi:Predicted transcriptional regulator [bacterium A37T11]|nr:Predicted transcriptional regulator [bacterium A37T11]
MFVYEIFVDLRCARKQARKHKYNMEKLTKQEEEAMQSIWRQNGGFIKELLDSMPEEQKVPYTTLASTVKNLEKKGYVQGVKYNTSYRYEPVIIEEHYKKQFINGFVNNYFENSYKDLVSFFAKEEKISTDELKEIIRLIEQKNN